MSQRCVTLYLMSQIGKSLTALEAGRADAALDHALTAWREHKAVALAEVVETLSAYAARDVSPPRAQTAKARHLAWLAAAETGNATDRHVLFETMVTLQSNKLTAERVLALTARGPDPRFTTWAFTFLYESPFSAATSRSSKLFRAVFDGLVANGDVRAIARLESLNADLAGKVIESARENLTKRGKRALKKLGSLTAPTLSDKERAACDAILSVIHRANAAAEARANKQPRTDTLLAEIFANPQELGPRYVLADLLAERGDPFGEFLQLQLRDADGKMPRKDRTRMNALQRMHGDEFVHGLAPHIAKTQRKFERGFLVQVKSQVVADHPALATVKALIGAHPTHDDHPLRSLEELTSTMGDCVPALSTLKKPLEHLHTLIVAGPHWEEARGGKYAWWDDRYREQFHQISVLPNVRRLGFTGSIFWCWDTGPEISDFDWVWDAAWTRSLKEFLVASHPRLIPDWVTLARKRGLDVLVVGDANEHPLPYELQFRFTNLGTDVTLVTGKRRGRVERIDRVLRQLAKVESIRSLTIDSRFASAYEGSRASLIQLPAFGEVTFGTARAQLMR